MYRDMSYTGEHEVRTSDLEVGEVIRMIHEPTPNYDKYVEETGIVIDKNDHEFVYINIDSPSPLHGWVMSQCYTDRGMEPYANGWNPSNHTERTGVQVSPSPLTEETALRLRDLFDRIADRQTAHGVEATQPTIQQTALNGLIAQAIDKKVSYFVRNAA